MVRITYVEYDGTKHEVDVRPGLSVMEGAVRHSIPGIEARCGGACSCATCHVYVDPPWDTRIGAPSAAERSLLSAVFGATERSRLSCQIKVSAALEGMVVRLPAFQG